MAPRSWQAGGPIWLASDSIDDREQMSMLCGLGQQRVEFFPARLADAICKADRAAQIRLRLLDVAFPLQSSER